MDTFEGLLAGRLKRGHDIHQLFAESLAPVAPDYDLVVVDTPPTRPLLLRLALGATRWIIVPTRPGRTSIEGLRALASEIAAVRQTNPNVELLGALLYDVETTATVIRRHGMDDITAVLGGAAPIFSNVVRHALSPVCESEEKGLLIHEVASRLDKRRSVLEGPQRGPQAGSTPRVRPSLGRGFRPAHPKNPDHHRRAGAGAGAAGMTSERAPLAAAPGLARTAAIPPPPPRRVQAAAEPPGVRRAEPAGPAPDTGTSTRMPAHPGMRAVTLSLPAPLVTAIKDRARAERVSQPDGLKDALSATRDRLDALLAPVTTPPTSDGLFLRRPPQRTTTDPMATLSLRLLTANLTAIDELVIKHQAPSRSALCAAALRGYLA